MQPYTNRLFLLFLNNKNDNNNKETQVHYTLANAKQINNRTN